jgi:hypothetical protein
MKTTDLYFTDAFDIDEETLEEFGAFNISLIVDLPLFVDPFLLFNSKEEKYQQLHTQIIEYLRYLRDVATDTKLPAGRLRELFCFPEVRQNWLGFSKTDNSGRGLGMKFARALADNLHNIFNDFGNEQVTQSSHLEKLCLIREGVGRDMISDFTNNLIRRFLCEYTQEFALAHLPSDRCRNFAVSHIDFHAQTGTWSPARFKLPHYNNDFVLLTPKDILTKDDTWINKQDFVREYHDIPNAIGDEQQRSRIDAYFQSVLPRDPDSKETAEAIRKTALQFPELFDYYIKLKEDTGDLAEKRSVEKVKASFQLYVNQFGELISLLRRESEFYQEPLTSKESAIEKIKFLKDVIENKGGWRLFYNDGQPIKKEDDLQICYRLVWHKTQFDVSREVNDGRGPADFKISHGAFDKTIVEMKLAKNTSLRRNLEKQAEIYQKASDAESALKVIICFSFDEQLRVDQILQDLKLDKCPDIFLIDARNDNKPSASKA